MPDYRLFIAVELPPDAKTALAILQKQLQITKAVRWTKPEQIHLTLQFLGDVPAEAVDTIPRALQASISPLPVFKLTLAGTGVFPNFKAPRIVWAGTAGGAEEVTLLYRAVIAATQTLGFTPENRPFKPHLTIGRVQNWARSGDYAQISATIQPYRANHIAEFAVDHVSLIRSELKPSGPTYTTLAKINLKR